MQTNIHRNILVSLEMNGGLFAYIKSSTCIEEGRVSGHWSWDVYRPPEGFKADSLE